MQEIPCFSETKIHHQLQMFDILKMDTFHLSIMMFLIISFKLFLDLKRIIFLLTPFKVVYGATLLIGMPNLNMRMAGPVASNHGNLQKHRYLPWV